MAANTMTRSRRGDARDQDQPDLGANCGKRSIDLVAGATSAAPKAKRTKLTNLATNLPALAGSEDSGSTKTSSKSPGKGAEKPPEPQERSAGLEQPSVRSRNHGRSLRSQQVTRYKSELSTYFPDYDEVIGNDPKEHHLLDADTLIILTDAAPRLPEGTATATPASSSHQAFFDPTAIRTYSDSLYTNICEAQTVDLSFLETQSKVREGENGEDPLPHMYYVHAHHKAERHERSLRNLEASHIQHAKERIVRLLEDLQGPTWPKVLGVGNTSRTKKDFESARDTMIKRCEDTLNTFREMDQQERRRKKDRAKGEGAGSRPGSRDSNLTSASRDSLKKVPKVKKNMLLDQIDVQESRPVSRDSNLTSESLDNRRKVSRSQRRKVVDLYDAQDSDEPVDWQPTAEREVAKRQRATRKWQATRTPSIEPGTTERIRRLMPPIPDFPVTDFELPADIRVDGAMKQRARQMRRERRGRP